MPWLSRRHDLVTVRGAVEKMAEAARRSVPGKPGGFVALLLASIGFALAAPLIAALLLRFGVPSRPCPDLACEQQDAATLSVVLQLSLPGLVLLLLAAGVWILRRRLNFTPPPGWPASPADWVPPPSWLPPDDWPTAPDKWSYWRLR